MKNNRHTQKKIFNLIKYSHKKANISNLIFNIQSN